MQTDTMITVHEFCIHHKLEQSFIFALKESGLIEVTMTQENYCIPVDQLPQLEKIIRLYELDINLEGIETITHLLDRISQQEQRIVELSNQLNRYQSDE